MRDQRLDAVEFDLAALKGNAFHLERLAIKIAGKIEEENFEKRRAIVEKILGKLEMLTAEEVRQIQKHVQTGVDMLKHIRFPGPVIQTIAQHHERLDGSGYPAGVKGDAVLRSAQLIAMADMLDAMTRERPYQSAQRWEEALTTLEAASGVLFEAELVQACAHLFRHEGYRFPAV